MTIMIAIIGLMTAVIIALLLAFTWRLWKLNEPTRLGWILILGESAVFVALIAILGRWDIAGLWTRTILLGLFVGAALVSGWRHARRPWLPAERTHIWRTYSPTIASLLLFGGALIYVMTGVFARHEPRDVAFPLDDGHYVVAQGGSIGVLNYHSSHPAQRHALDIGAVDTAGFRASGLLPPDPTRYAVFGKPVVSPCDGMVAAAVDGLPDQPPPTTDRDNPAGNHIVLACGDLRVELAHLRQGSVAVAVGQTVRVGAPIGQVGNSGNTTEPHLHIHAVDAVTGAGVQLSFGGVVPVRNTSVHR